MFAILGDSRKLTSNFGAIIARRKPRRKGWIPTEQILNMVGVFFSYYQQLRVLKL